MANPVYPRWRDWRKCVGGNGENYIDANRELLDRQDARIAELEAQAQTAEAAKSQDAADKLVAEIERVRAEASEEKVAYELRFAGAKNVTAAKAVLRRARR